jgi:diaminopropionate ammonia-lyase
LRVKVLVNEHVDPGAVPAPSRDAASFHSALPGYAPTPVRELPEVAASLGISAVLVKDESARFGLPAFKILGASWAVERALRERPEARTLVTASAGNHGRAVARVAAMRGLRARVFLPERSLELRRAAIASEGAEVVVVAGSYEDAVAAADAAAGDPGVLAVADVGESGPAAWVVDGYATLFDEADAQAAYDVVVVPVGVGSLAAAAARHGAATGRPVVAAEPAAAACLTASLGAGRPTTVETPGTIMAGLDCAQLSPYAWPTLLAGIHGAVTVTDEEARAAQRELADAGLEIGESGAAPLAALRTLAIAVEASELRRTIGLRGSTRILLLATEGRTGERGRPESAGP